MVPLFVWTIDLKGLVWVEDDPVVFVLLMPPVESLDLLNQIVPWNNIPPNKDIGPPDPFPNKICQSSTKGGKGFATPVLIPNFCDCNYRANWDPSNCEGAADPLPGEG